MWFTFGDLLFIGLSFWILGEGLWDLFHSNEIPPLLMFPPFVLALIFRGMAGLQGLIVVFVLLVGVFSSEIKNRWIRWAIGIVVSVLLFMVGGVGLGVGWLIFWIFYEGNILSGADVVACLALLVVSPTMALVFCLLMAIGLTALVTGIRRHGWSVFGKSLHTYGRLFRGQWFTEEELVATGAPMIFGLFFGAVAYYVLAVFLLRLS
jgi:hypothetical protein